MLLVGYSHTEESSQERFFRVRFALQRLRQNAVKLFVAITLPHTFYMRDFALCWVTMFANKALT
jgi:hypothetical protein